MGLSEKTVNRSDSGEEYPYKWVGKRVSLSYDLDGGTGDFPVQELCYSEGSTGPASESVSTKISASIPQKENNCFAGWEAGGKTYAPGDTITIKTDTVLKALWANISLSDNGGNNGTVTYGTDLEIRATPNIASVSRYQWYRNDTDSNQGGTLVSDSGTAALTIPSTTPVGTGYYYCTAEVSVGEGGSTLPVTSRVVKIVVEPKALSISNVEAVSRAYDGTQTVEIQHEGLSGVVNGDEVGLPDKITGTMANPDAGSDKAVMVEEILLSGANQANYTLIQPTDLKVDITPATLRGDTLKMADKTFPYGSEITLSPVLNGVNNETVSAEYEYTWYMDAQLTKLYGTDGKTAPSSSGTYYVRAECTGVKSSNYQLPAEPLAASACITILYPYIPQPTPAPEIPENYPDGTVKNPDGSYTTPDEVVIKPDGGIILPDGTELAEDSEGNKPSIDKEGTVTDTNGTAVKKDGTIILPGKDISSAKDDTVVSQGSSEKPVYLPANGTVILKEGNEVTLQSGIKVTPQAGSVVQNDGTVTEPDGTVIRPDGSVENPDGSIQNAGGAYVRPAETVIEENIVNGNVVKINLEKAAAGAEGYDYVISKNPNCIREKDYFKVNKNTPVENTAFRYLPKGTYYVAVHGWMRNEEGKKVFGPWSDVIKIKVTAVTPSKPQIRNTQVSRSTVRVTYTKSAGATGYDLVLGKAVKKVNGELRPVNYGKLVKKVTKGNTVIAVFKNVPAGTYYLGLHAYNRTAEDGRKVFSQWAGVKKIIIK